MHSDRVTYVPGPPDEQAIIERIYAMYPEERMNHVAIAARLHSENVSTCTCRPWSAHLVKQVLTNDKYADLGRMPLYAPSGKSSANFLR